MSSASEPAPRAVLHVLTTAEEALATELIAAQRTDPRSVVWVFDLRSPAPDYDTLLDAVFAADSITVW